MVNGSALFIPFFSLFFILIIIIIYYSSVKEKEFSESVKIMIENRFPNLETVLVSEGGFFSNPEIYASPKGEDYPIRELLLEYKVYGSGKHRQQDLLLSAVINTEHPLGGIFSVIIKKEGFFRRVFGGENVQLGHKSLDDRLLIQASDPAAVLSYLSRGNFQIATKIANISDLKECKIEKFGDGSISLVLRSDHTNIRYVGTLLDLVSALANLETMYPIQQERSVFKSTRRRIIEKIPHRKERFKDISFDGSFAEPLNDVNHTISLTQDVNLQERVKERISDKSYLASEYKILNTSAELIFNINYFRAIKFNWDSNVMKVTGSKELALTPFLISMKRISTYEEESTFGDAFEKIDLKTEPQELADSLKDRSEIARNFNRLTGSFSPILEISSDNRTVSFSILASNLPENIDPLYSLTQSIGWFLEFSFL
ncbi:MAG: hypothetical protein ACFE9A_18110 [Candidatus Hodarchaeota archaeon]